MGFRLAEGFGGVSCASMLGLTARPAGLQLACCCRSASCVRVTMWCEFGGAGSIFCYMLDLEVGPSTYCQHGLATSQAKAAPKERPRHDSSEVRSSSEGMLLSVLSVQ